MRAFHDHLVGRKRKAGADQAFGLALEIAEEAQQQRDVGLLEVVFRLLDLVLVVDVAIAHAGRPHEVVDTFLVLQVHREPLEPVGDLAEHRLAGNAADFLEVSELGHFHAVQPDLPTPAPCAERRRLPVVLDEPDVVHLGVDADRIERFDKNDMIE